MFCSDENYAENVRGYDPRVSIIVKTEDKWEYYYDDSTLYVGGKHPRGGKRSVCEMSRSLSSEDRIRIGNAIAELLNKDKSIVDNWSI